MFDIVTLILFFCSLGFWVMGCGLLFSNKMKEKFMPQIKAKDKDEYIKFNGRYNIILGVITTSLSAVSFLLPEYKVYVAIVYVIFIFASASFQVKLGQKYM